MMISGLTPYNFQKNPTFPLFVAMGDLFFGRFILCFVKIVIKLGQNHDYLFIGA